MTQLHISFRMDKLSALTLKMLLLVTKMSALLFAHLRILNLLNESIQCCCCSCCCSCFCFCFSGADFEASWNMPIDNKNSSVTMNFTVSNTCRPPNNTIKYIKVYSCTKSACKTICTVQYENGTCAQLLKKTNCSCDPQTQQLALKGRVNGSRCECWKLEGQLKNDHKFTKIVKLPCKLSISLSGHKPK